MQSLVLPRPNSLLSTPFRQSSEAEDSLAKFRSKFSPNRPELQGYPSPPMSEPQSPSHRSAQSVDTARLSHPPPRGASQRPEGLPLGPPPSSLYDARSTLASQGHPQHRPLYPGEPQHRGQALYYQPGRHIEHHPYGNPPTPQGYGYGYPNAGAPHFPGNHSAGHMVHQATMIPPAPARSTKPARRTKAHVASACINCKKAHLSCDVQRPCGRCVASGKQDSCKDVQHKKRGRPRLRDDREFTRPEEGGPPHSQMMGVVPVSETFPQQLPFPASHSHRGTEPPRILTGTTQGSHPSSNQSNKLGDHGGALASSYGVGPNLAYQQLPVAYLNLDLVIQKSNQAFADLVSFLGNTTGKHLGELLEARQNESLQRLRNELRDERDEREPAYMAPITPVGQDPMRAVMESVSERDIDSVSHGYTDRPMFLSFRLPSSGQYQSLQVQIRLAKTSLYFVTLVVRSPPRPPLLTQQLAPPTPRHASQTMSAPATGPATQFTPHQTRPASSTSSAPSSPYFNFSSVRTSLPTFSPSSYAGSPSYGYSPTTGAGAGTESGYFAYQAPPQPAKSAYPSPYVPTARAPPASSESLREPNGPARLEGLQLPPIRTGPAALGSPLHIESSVSERVRRRESPSGGEQRRPETPETGKRRRLNIREVLE